MKSFLFAFLLSMFILNKVSGKQLICYRNFADEDAEDEVVTCPGNDDVCVTVVDKDDPNKVLAKNCLERENVESDCQRISDVECKQCDSDLCNNQGSTNKLKCYRNFADENAEDEVVICPGNDDVCVTVVDKDDPNKVLAKNCIERENVESDCQRISDVECKQCDSDLCNNQK